VGRGADEGERRAEADSCRSIKRRDGGRRAEFMKRAAHPGGAANYS
jgi:hypothetical protein